LSPEGKPTTADKPPEPRRLHDIRHASGHGSQKIPRAGRPANPHDDFCRLQIAMIRHSAEASTSDLDRVIGDGQFIDVTLLKNNVRENVPKTSVPKTSFVADQNRIQSAKARG
jgi:hypothetical protein